MRKKLKNKVKTLLTLWILSQNLTYISPDQEKTLFPHSIKFYW